MNNETTTPLAIKQKQIVIVNAKWNKFRDDLFLINFVDQSTGWCGAYKIILGGYDSKYANHRTFIHQKYLGTRTMNGYVNVFSGGVTLNSNDIIEVKSELPDDVYSKIVEGVMLQLTGRWIVTDDGKYRLLDNPITISPSILLQACLSGVIAHIQQEGETKVKIEEAPKTETPKTKQLPPVVKQPKPIIPENKDERKPFKVTIETSKEDILKTIEFYNMLETTEDRIEYLFEVWAENDRLPLNSVFETIFNAKDYKPRKSSFAFTKQEVQMILNEKQTVLQQIVFQKLDGSSSKIKTFGFLKTKIRRLITNNKEKIGHEVQKTRNKERADKIKEMFSKGMTPSQIANSFEPNERTYVRSYICSLYKDAGDRMTQKRLMRLHQSDNAKLSRLAAYLINNYNLIGAISRGKVPKSFNGNKNELIATAIFAIESKYSAYKIALAMPDFMRSKEGLDFVRSLTYQPSLKRTLPYISLTSTTANQAERRKVLYSYLVQPKVNTASKDAKFFFKDILHCTKAQLDEDLAYVQNNMSTLDSELVRLSRSLGINANRTFKRNKRVD